MKCDNRDNETRLTMFQLLKLFVDFDENLNVFLKDKESSFFESSLKKDDELSDVNDVFLQAIN